LFKIGDKDGNGTLDKTEVTSLLGMSGFNFDLSSADQVLETCDKNKDGVIDYDEFVDMMTKHCLINDDAVVPDAPASKPSKPSFLENLMKSELDRGQLEALLAWTTAELKKVPAKAAVKAAGTVPGKATVSPAGAVPGKGTA